MCDPTLYRRRSIRLKGYDCSQTGAYHVVLCTHRRTCLFGEVTADGMQPSEPGEMVARSWLRLPGKFPHVDVDAFVLMPNHLHGIILITAPNAVGADPCVRPSSSESGTVGAHAGAPLHRMVQWFKTMTTNAYIRGVRARGVRAGRWPRFEGKVWQRGYWDRVIRTDQELHDTRRYIINNPLQWAEDHENPANVRL